jgi:UDPglucose 6-dehydrogenase
MRIAVVGTGYVGLVAGVCFAESGNDVVCVDTDATKVRALSKGKVPIYEPGLEELLRRNRTERRLTFTTALPKAVRDAAVVFIAVGTPQGEDGSADLQHVLTVAKDVAKAMNGYKVIVNKSTVPVGTAERVREVIRRETTHPFSVVSNPEFLKQGAAIDDFMKPDRVVVGAEDDRAKEMMLELYAPFTRTDAPIMMMDCASAELAKYAANAMLATRISFMNEVANVCEAVGADVDQVRRAVGAVNMTQKTRLAAKMKKHFGSLKGKVIAVWGLAFKPKTDDMREAPAIALIESLLAAGASVQVYDPEAMAVAKKHFGSRITYADANYAALKGADALAIVTEWNEFRRPDFERIRSLMKTPVIFDGRNLFVPAQMKQNGFTYYSIGRR